MNPHHNGFPIITVLLILASIPFKFTSPNPDIPSGLYSIRPGQPTLVDLPYFNRTLDVEFLWKALKTLDDDAVLKVAHLGSMRSKKQRLQILEGYKQKYGVDIVAKYLHSDLFGNDEVGVLTRALFMPLVEFYATEVKWAIKGFSTSETTLSDIFCCLNPAEISVRDITNEYLRLYGGDGMQADISDDVSGAYGQLLNALVLKKRRSDTDDTHARNGAQAYFDDVKTESFLHMENFFYREYFSIRSYEDIRRTSRYFDELGSTTFIEYLDKVATANFWNTLSGDLIQLNPFSTSFRDLLVDIVKYSVNKTNYFLDLIETGVEDKDARRLIRIFALRSDKDLELIKSGHERISDGAPSLAAFFLWKSGQVRYRSKRVLLLLVKVICGNRDPDRDLDLEQMWDDTRKCPKDDVDCGVSKLCLGAPSYLLVPANNPQKLRW